MNGLSLVLLRFGWSVFNISIEFDRLIEWAPFEADWLVENLYYERWIFLLLGTDDEIPPAFGMSTEQAPKDGLWEQNVVKLGFAITLWLCLDAIWVAPLVELWKGLLEVNLIGGYLD